jgi:hypothetical protein
MSVLTAPVTHQDQGLQQYVFCFNLRPLSASADPENLRFQAVSKGCLTEPVVTNQPLVAHDMGGQAVDDRGNWGWNGWPIRNRGFLPTLPLVPRSNPLLIGITFLGQKAPGPSSHNKQP